VMSLFVTRFTNFEIISGTIRNYLRLNLNFGKRAGRGEKFRK
jgi:hypothetical protein